MTGKGQSIKDVDMNFNDKEIKVSPLMPIWVKPIWPIVFKPNFSPENEFLII